MGIELTKLFSNLLKEGDTIRLSEDSVDSQIDSILLRYQSEASLEDDELENPQINEGYSMPENWNLLLEQGEDEEEATPDMGDIMSVGDEIPRSTTPADPQEKKINIDDFAQKIANLYEHYDNLLNVKPVIVHRAMHLIERGYPADVVDQLLEVLEREFGITLDGDSEDEIPVAPPGGSAGPIGA